MTQPKFNINDLPDLKIRVNTPEESERAQRAFFALGENVRWFFGTPHQLLENIELPNTLIYAPNSQMPNILGCFGKLGSHREIKDFGDYAEITLPELEALAAEKQAAPQLGTFYSETMDEIEERIIANGGYQDKANQEAQARYDAAVALLDNCGFYASGDYSDVAYKAILIASGLPIEPE